MLLQLCRSSRVPVWDGIWAEDARYFYSNARDHPWHSTLFEPLANYLQVVPRFWSIIAAQFPVADAAFIISVTAAFTVSLLSAYVFVATRGVLPRVWQRAAVAALIAVHPAAGYESNAALNNVHWFLMLAAFWACLSEAKGRARTASDVVVVVLSALSDALTALWLPIVLIRARRGSGSSRWVASGLLAALIVQYVLAVHDGTSSHGGREWSAYPEVYAYRVLGSLLVGEVGNLRLFEVHGAAWAVFAALLVGLVVLVGILLSRGRQRSLMMLGLGYSIVFLLAPLVVRGGGEAYLAQPPRFAGSRYLIVPLYLGYTSLIVLAGLRPFGKRLLGQALLRLPRGAGESRSARRLPEVLVPLAVGLLLAGHLAFNYDNPGARTASASWRQQVVSAKVACDLGQVGRRVPSSLPRRAQPYLRTPGIVWLPVAPWSDNWPARIRCSEL
jgi:hypothetical protein